MQVFSEPPGAEIGLQALTELGSQWGPKLQFDHVVKSHKELKRKGMNIYRLRVFYEAFKGQQRIYMNFFSYEVNGKLHLIAINTSFCMCCCLSLTCL